MLQLAPDTAVRLESPLAVPHHLLTHVAISGWIISRKPIARVGMQPGCQSLTLIDRPDVRAVYPGYPCVSGYIGIVPTASLAHAKTLVLDYDVDGTRHTQDFRLDGKRPLLTRALRLFGAATPETSAPEQSLDTALRFLRLVNRQLHEVDVQRRHAGLLSTPLDINLEATNRCNLACPTCARNYWDQGNNPIGDMRLDLLDRLTPFIERAQSVNFLGYGEPALSATFKPMVEKLARLRPNFTMFNNGTTLGPELVDFILGHDFKGVTVSIDGATEATVQQTRTASLSRIMANVERLTRTSAQRRLPCPELSLSFTASRRNIGELRALVPLAAERGFQRIYVGMFKIFARVLREESLFLVPDLARREFLAAQELGGKCGVDVIVPPEFGATVTCNQPFHLVLMKWDGRMRLCCSTAIVSVPPLYIEAGNVYETAAEELWNGGLAQKVRRGLAGAGEPHPLCAGCAFTGFNLDRYTRYLSP
jgi:MoaA/NifB/PqqE/SkfB family radical SAM enzyme